MFRCTAVSTETYHADIDGFMVDVVESADTYSAFLYHSNHIDKIFMFGVLKAETTKEEFLCMVCGNLDRYVEIYMEEYCD